MRANRICLRSVLLGAACCLSLTVAATPAAASSFLLGDSILGSYSFPCISCVYSNFSYSRKNPFVVGGTVETSLTIDGFSTWDVDFGKDSLVLTLVDAGPGGSVFYNSDPFNGPVFTVLRGNSFGSVSGLTVDRHCTPCSPVEASISGDSLFINWQGGGGNVGDTITVNFVVGAQVINDSLLESPVSSVPIPNVGAGLPGLILASGGLLGWWRRFSGLKCPALRSTMGGKTRCQRLRNSKPWSRAAS